MIRLVVWNQKCKAGANLYVNISIETSMLFLFFFNEFIDLFMAVLRLCCCAWAFSSCAERGLLFVAVHEHLIAVTSLSCRARALGARASAVVAHGLSSCGSRALERRLSSCGARA